ncbi:MAG TPA: hypothetical protein VMJ65_00010 [Solirubrobacteraceae bacterium]|nr:hypothetical protein [Solirubrobacteraceae bacterium]
MCFPVTAGRADLPDLRRVRLAGRLLRVERCLVRREYEGSLGRRGGREVLVGGMYLEALLAPVAVELREPVDDSGRDVNGHGPPPAEWNGGRHRRSLAGVGDGHLDCR